MLETYSALIMQQPVIPEPSKLYSLKPEGLGTPETESLTSYAMRLAEAHCIDVCDLINRFIHPLVGNKWKNTPPRRGVNTVHKVHKHNVTPAHLHIGKWIDMTKETQATVAALAELTKRHNLHLLTLLPLSGYVRQKTVLRYQRAWCPCCYEEQKNSGRLVPVYDLLIWSFHDVCACPRHEQILWSACFWCSARQPILNY